MNNENVVEFIYILPSDTLLKNWIDLTKTKLDCLFYVLVMSFCLFKVSVQVT